MFDRTKLFEHDHLRFVLRNSLAIIFAFWIGYCGFPMEIQHVNIDPLEENKGEQRPVMLPKFSAGIANLLTLMLTNYAGSAVGGVIRKGRGIIAGCIFGMLLVGMFERLL